MITLLSGNFGWDYLIKSLDTNETIWIQSDRDYDGVAQTFGWDGNGCAQAYLDEIADSEVEVDDPGYFG